MHRSGEPTWLAQKIRKRNDDRVHSNSQRYCMVHLEIFWKDDSIKPKEPKNEKSMNIFSDWGVVTISNTNSMTPFLERIHLCTTHTIAR